MSAGMKCCPLCGARAHTVEFSPTSGPAMYFAVCGNGGCRLNESVGVSHMQPTNARAVEAWNRRVEPWEPDSWELEDGRITAVWYGETRYVREGA